MKYVVKSNEIDSFSNEIEKIINMEINPTISVMDKLARKTLWSGKGRRAFVNSYDSTMDEIKKIPHYLYLYNEFLGKVINNYGEALDELKKELKKLEDELEKRGEINEQKDLLQPREY